MLILALTLFSVVTALPQPLPLPNPTDVLPTLTLVNFAKSTKKITGTRTKVDDTSGGGGVVTKVVNKTVTTTGKYRGTSKGKPALITGKLAGIIVGAIIGAIILLVLAIYIYKRRQKKRALLNPSPTSEEDQMEEKKVDPNEVVSLPGVPGEMAYAEEPANPAPGNAPAVAPLDKKPDGTDQSPRPAPVATDGLPATSLSKS